MKITVSELIVQYMQRLGIETIFGMPGAHILPMYDSLYDSTIHTVLVKHEQGAAFMACGNARVSGRISACITTAGPGATNLVTGIANAYADRLSVLIITGEAPTYIFGKGGLQESSGEGGSIDQVTLFKGITRYNRVIERTDYLPNVLNQASRILLAPSSGPVLLSIPYNVQKELVDDTLLDEVVTSNRTSAVSDNCLPIEELGQLIADSERPVIVAGYGCVKAGAKDLAAELCETMNIPVATSLKGKGIVSEQSPLSLGSLGVTSYTNAYDYIRDQADLIIFLGASFNERTSYVWDKTLLQGKKIAQVDNNVEQLEKVFRADVAIHGDIKDVLTGLLNTISKTSLSPRSLGDIQDYDLHAEQDPSNDYAVFRARFPLVEKFFDRLEKQFPKNIMLFDDNIIFAQNFYKVSNGNSYYSNSGISSLGHAIPAAIGARFAIEIPAFAILGDGGFQMCCMEIMTAVNYNIPLNIVLFNNGTMGLIRKNQFQQYDKRFINCDFINPDYAKLAASFGINHRRIEKVSDIESTFDNTDFYNAINLIEIMLDKDAFPTYSSRR